MLLAALGASARGQRVKVWVSSNDELSRMYQLLTTAFPSGPGEEFAASIRIETTGDCGMLWAGLGLNPHP